MQDYTKEISKLNNSLKKKNFSTYKKTYNENDIEEFLEGLGRQCK